MDEIPRHLSLSLFFSFSLFLSLSLSLSLSLFLFLLNVYVYVYVHVCLRLYILLYLCLYVYLYRYLYAYPYHLLVAQDLHLIQVVFDKRLGAARCQKSYTHNMIVYHHIYLYMIGFVSKIIHTQYDFI